MFPSFLHENSLNNRKYSTNSTSVTRPPPTEKYQITLLGPYQSQGTISKGRRGDAPTNISSAGVISTTYIDDQHRTRP